MIDERTCLAQLASLQAALSALDTQRSQTASLLTSLSAQVSDLCTEVERVPQRIEPLMEVAAQFARDVRGSREPSPAVTSAIAELERLVTQSESLLGDLGAMVDNTSQSVEDVASSLPETREWINIYVQGIDLLEEAGDDWESALAVADDRVQSIVDTASGRIQEIKDSIDEAVSQLPAQIENLLHQPMSELRENLTRELTSRIDAIVENTVRAASTQVQSCIAKELDPAVQLAARLIGEALAELERAITSGLQENQSARAVLDPALEQLKGVIDPVLTELGRIRELGSSVGLHI